MKWPIAVLLTWTVAAAAHAHLMVEQHATLNFVNGGAFLVISVPVSAFSGIDDDNDGMLSVQELDAHIGALQRQVLDGVILVDRSGDVLPLQGLMVSLSPPDHDPGGPAKQVIALGRFPADIDVMPEILQIKLWGTAPEERVFDVTVKRSGKSRRMTFTTERDSFELFSD